MTIKLVQGLVDRSGFSPPTRETSGGEAAKVAPQANPAAVVQQQATSTANAVATAVRSTEAVVTTLRSNRAVSQGERLQPKEAEAFANDLAKRIRETETPDVESHGKLEFLVAGDHLR